MDDKIKFEDLTKPQQKAANYILESIQFSIKYYLPGRKSGKTFLIKYIVQELTKQDKQLH